VPKLNGIVTFYLENGEQRHAESPDQFQIPSVSERASLQAGDHAKLLFCFTNGDTELVERMWVRIVSREGDEYIGTLANDPYCTEQIRSGIEIRFRPHHVISIKGSNSSANSP
jgi:uncharacterized protein YegJ (DUF2314 family)